VVVAGSQVGGGVLRIAVQPVSQVVNPDDVVNFTVTVIGNSVQYQWYKDNVPVVGATSATLSFTAKKSDEGSYFCFVSNPAGSAKSNIATLIVNNPLRFVVQPVPAVVVPYHGVLSLSVVAAGSVPITYQWHKGVNELAGETKSSLSIPMMEARFAGNYTCVVTNVTGSLESHVSVVTVADPAVTQDPTSQSLLGGQHWKALFSVTAVGSGPLSFRWLKNGVNFPLPLDSRIVGGVESSSLEIDEVATADDNNTYYSCVVHGDGGDVVSNQARLTVDDHLAIHDQPRSVTVDPGSPPVGQNYTFLCIGMGAGDVNLGYQWRIQREGQAVQDIPDATSIYFTVPYARYSDEGTYTCAVSSSYGTLVSNPAVFEVNGAPIAFIAQPVGLMRYVGELASFTVDGVTGGFYNAADHVPGYHWKFRDSQDVITDVGDNSPDLYLKGLAMDNAGTYYCEVTDDSPFSPYKSGEAALNVGVSLEITQHPQGGTKREFDKYTFTVGTSGGVGTLHYQWKKDDVVIHGATKSFYTIASLSVKDGGYYSVSVTDDHTGVLESNRAHLTVLPLNRTPVFSGVAGLFGLALLLALAAMARIRKGQVG
jgi:hypothetical protein